MQILPPASFVSKIDYLEQFPSCDAPESPNPWRGVLTEEQRAKACAARAKMIAEIDGKRKN